MQRLYLDANATEPMRPEAIAAMAEAMALPGNPSSVHAEGRAARRVLEEAREAIAARFGARGRDVVFTSGGTEANALAIRGLAAGRRVLVGATEHPAVLAAAGSAAGEDPGAGAPRDAFAVSTPGHVSTSDLTIARNARPSARSRASSAASVLVQKFASWPASPAPSASACTKPVRVSSSAAEAVVFTVSTFVGKSPSDTSDTAPAYCSLSNTVSNVYTRSRSARSPAAAARSSRSLVRPDGTTSRFSPATLRTPASPEIAAKSASVSTSRVVITQYFPDPYPSRPA